MVTHRIKSQILSKTLLQIISLILGYSLWSIAIRQQIVQIWLEIPLSFYNTPKDLILNAPENIMITIEGKRTDLYLLDTSKLAAHCDAQSLSLGQQVVFITQQNLFLPNSIK